MVSVSNTEALQVRGISKVYRTGFLRKKNIALKNITLSVPVGSIFGLLGPNGSGKTTLIKIVTGLVGPTAGSFQVMGRPLDKIAKARLGYLPDKPHHYSFLTPTETLSFFADLFGMNGTQKKERMEEVLLLVGMQDKRQQRLNTFSKGMLQRVALAQALLNDPDLLILDEPIGGLDPWGLRLLKDVFLSMKKAGKTVLFSSHLLSYAQELCDHFAILNNGQLVCAGAMPRDKKLEDLFLEKCEPSAR